MSTNATLPMIGTHDGQIYDVPVENAGKAVAAGVGKLAIPMISPDGSKGYIPHDQVVAAQKAGGTIDHQSSETRGVLQKFGELKLAPVDRPPMPPAPTPDLKPSYAALAVQNSPSNASPENPANPNPELLNQMDPETRSRTENALFGTAASMVPAIGAEAAAESFGPAILKHISQPGAILKFPFGRALEYYMVAKLGLKKEHISDVAALVGK